jgi:hypothetical protein
MFLHPGDGWQEFTCYSKQSDSTPGGRPKSAGLTPCGTLEGIISDAKPSEILAWKQNDHPITCKIVQENPDCVAEAEDVLAIEAEGAKPRYFYVQGLQNPGDLYQYVIYFCQERKGLDG